MRVALITTLLLLASLTSSFHEPQRLGQAIRVDAKQQSDGTLKGEQSSSDEKRNGAPSLSASSPQVASAVPKAPAADAERPRSQDTQQSRSEASEYWPDFFGHRVKITDSLLAAFTLALVAIGWWQGTKLQGTIDLARDEFISTHRPKISVHAIEAKEDTESLPVARVFYINKGGTTATIEQIRAVVVKASKPMAHFGSVVVGDEINPFNATLASGMKDSFDVKFPELQSGPKVAAHSGQNYFCIGIISYMDGANNRRETGFIRVLRRDQQTNIGPRRWMRLDEDSEYQYEY